MISLFGWKCCRGILPTKISLAWKLPYTDPQCSICHDVDESIMYAQFKCSWVVNVWKDRKLPIVGEIHISSNFVNFLDLVREKQTKEDIQFMWIVAWRVWFGRNAIIFRGAEIHHTGIISFCHVYLLEMDKVRTIETPNAQSELSNGAHVPSLLSKSTVMDHCLKEREGDAGIVVRDMQGTVVMAASTKFQQIIDPPTTEVLSIMQAMKLALGNGWRRIVVESDAEAVLTEIRAKNPCLTLYMGM
ncbi:RVT_3 domain-containing protein [Cephalotus follicularis]|uniref:RVT_3 domain-containing protein n=1 Tax=Cephalotus follicularis TaxID=3775 RepID=A0A1Q3AY77_CEPFO|nr:RVT_3 domain-containing protein [Cephalotus follicularis]